MARERSWIVRFEGFPEASTTDLTLDEAALAEQVSGVPYTIMNPLASVKVAKALLVLALKRAKMRDGVPEAEAETAALKAASSATLEVLAGAFEFVPGEVDLPAAEGDASPPRSAPTSATG